MTRPRDRVRSRGLVALGRAASAYRGLTYSDPFGTEPCTQEQLQASWTDVTATDGTPQCKSGGGLPPVTVTANAFNSPNAWGASSNFGNPNARGGGLTGSEAAAVIGQLAGMAPAINTAVAGFLPATASVALGAAPLAASGGLTTLGLPSAGLPVTFFRGVSAAEAAQVAATRALQLGPSGMGVKYLTNTISAAQTWGGPGSFVVQVQVSQFASRGFTYLGRIDGVGQAWTATVQQLAGARLRILP